MNVRSAWPELGCAAFLASTILVAFALNATPHPIRSALLQAPPLACLFALGYRLGVLRRERLHDAHERQLEAKLRIADMTIDSMRCTIADGSSYRGEPQTGSWPRPSA
ncbi:MAG TPA: hypothetical protein VE987_12990 [Polyangiaceae bacterium]|nr:hypothetical protein [Polyangiaceae bacterium]